MLTHKLYSMLIALVLIVATVKPSSTSWRDTLNVNSIKSYLAALYTGNQGSQQGKSESNKPESLTYDACIDFVADFLNTNLGAFTPDQQVTLLQFKKMMVQKLYQDEVKRTAITHDVDAKIATLQKK